MVHPDNRIIPARPGETILEAVLREGIAFPYECRNGGCGKCKCTVLYGPVEQGPHQESALSAAERAQGMVLACSATPLADIEIEYVPLALPGGVRPREYTAQGDRRCSKATDDVMIVKLAVEGGEPIRFYAGQYINIILPDGEQRSFSFATAPHENDVIELQIRLHSRRQVHDARVQRDEGRRHRPLRGPARLVLPARGLATSRSSSSPAPPASRR